VYSNNSYALIINTPLNLEKIICIVRSREFLLYCIPLYATLERIVVIGDFRVQYMYLNMYLQLLRHGDHFMLQGVWHHAIRVYVVGLNLKVLAGTCYELGNLVLYLYTGLNLILI
jgi:hypothetical protein